MGTATKSLCWQALGALFLCPSPKLPTCLRDNPWVWCKVCVQAGPKIPFQAEKRRFIPFACFLGGVTNPSPGKHLPHSPGCHPQTYPHFTGTKNGLWATCAALPTKMRFSAPKRVFYPCCLFFKRHQKVQWWQALGDLCGVPSPNLPTLARDNLAGCGQAPYWGDA